MNLKDHYEKLRETPPPSEKQAFRDKVMATCHISKDTFYRWIRNPKTIPALAQEKISEIMFESARHE